jgi:hypothetical protein
MTESDYSESSETLFLFRILVFGHWILFVIWNL